MFRYNIKLNGNPKFHKSRSSIFLIGAAFILLALAIGIVIRLWVAEKPAIASRTVGDEAINQNGYNMDTLSISSEDDWELLSVYTEDDEQIVPSAQPNLFTQTSNGVEVTVSNFRREGEVIKVDICYEMPDASDWMFDNTTMLMFGGEQVSLSGLSYNELRHPDTEGQNGYRCGDIEFRNVPVYADNEEFRLIINQIVGPPSESEGCDFYLSRVQSKLDAQNSGIKINCNPEEMWRGNGITVESKPDSMSIAEAEQLVFSQEHYAFHGLWEFKFRLDQ